MPSRIAPSKSGAHRLACLSVYRALLRQSSALTRVLGNDHTTHPSQDALYNLTRFCFRRDRSLQSGPQIANGLKAGYKALDLLHVATTKQPSALSELSTLISSIASQTASTSAWRATLAAHRPPTSPKKLPKIAHIRSVATKANHSRFPGSKPVLERPLPLSEIKSGKRRVPALIVTSGVPFLRYHKPQPVSLGRVIRQRVKYQADKWEKRKEFEYWVSLARWEEEWDELVLGQASQETVRNGYTVGLQSLIDELQSKQREEPDWTQEIANADREAELKIRQDDQKNRRLAHKMWDIVVQERELAEAETRAARIERRLKRARRPDRLGGTLQDLEPTSHDTLAEVEEKPAATAL